MKISQWLANFYQKKFDPDNKGFEVLQHDTGLTYNDGGSWNDTIIRVGDDILRVYMPSDYCCDHLEVTKMKEVLIKSYEKIS